MNASKARRPSHRRAGNPRARNAIGILCVILLAGLMTACSTGPRKSRTAFIERFSHTYNTDRIEVFDVVRHRDEFGEPRYLVIGAYPTGDGRWGILWGDCGELRQFEWHLLDYPASPHDYVTSREEALEAAASLRAEFVESWTSPEP